MITSVSSLIPLLLLVSQVVAVPNVVRDESSTATSTTTGAPTPWVSILGDGSGTTITPVVSTNSAGQATTIDAQPTGTSDSTTENPSDDNREDVFARCDSTKYELAKTGNGQPYIPFCAPKNSTNWWVSGNYYVTWNPKYYATNSTVNIVLNYVTAGGAGKVAGNWDSRNAFGFINIQPNKKWLLNQTALADGQEHNLENQTMAFTITGESGPQAGPTIVLTAAPTAAPVDTDPRNRPSVSMLGLAIGLPLVLVFTFGSICGLHFCMRNKRSVGPISIGGGRKHFSKRGYSGRAERRRLAAQGGQAEYRDETEDGVTTSPTDERRAEWELANVKGGR